MNMFKFNIKLNIQTVILSVCIKYYKKIFMLLKQIKEVKEELWMTSSNNYKSFKSFRVTLYSIRA